MQYVLILERALEGVMCVGPFASREAADKYARAKYAFPQVWRVSELAAPETAKE